MFKYKNLFFYSPDDAGGGSNGGEAEKNPPKTYSEDEYNKLKSTLDKVNAENKKYKDEAKAKMTEEEKRKEQEEENLKKTQAMEKELRELKLKTQLATGGFNEQEINKIVELRMADDDKGFASYLCELRKALIDNATKEAQKKFSQGNYVPDGGDGGNGESEATSKAKNFNKKSENKKSWGQFGK